VRRILRLPRKELGQGLGLCIQFQKFALPYPLVTIPSRLFFFFPPLSFSLSSYCSFDFTSNYFYPAKKINSLYGIDTSDTTRGAGTVIAIVDAYGMSFLFIFVIFDEEKI
jgi:hypothetical protein